MTAALPGGASKPTQALPTSNQNIQGAIVNHFKPLSREKEIQMLIAAS